MTWHPREWPQKREVQFPWPRSPGPVWSCRGQTLKGGHSIPNLTLQVLSGPVEDSQERGGSNFPGRAPQGLSDPEEASHGKRG